MQESYSNSYKNPIQVIGGDETGARKTQEQFARTEILASQVNSLVHSIQGNNREAEKIQEEFGLTMYEVAKGTPVIGHGIAAGHAFAGKVLSLLEACFDLISSPSPY